MSRKGRRTRAEVALVEAGSLVRPGPPRVRPPGQRLFDMPYSALAPRLANPSLGLQTLVARAGHNAGYEIDVTLLDAPDHRLIRSGVLLAHRVLDGRGEWYLTAPDWEPLLPRDRVEMMGDRDLPESLADLIRPLRRRAHLGPVAALRCERREFALRDDSGTTVALVRDDKVTVRRGGLTTARYREVMVTPVGPGLTDEQDGWLERSLLAAGSTLVPRFPRLLHRLGAPATGPSDLPPVSEVVPEETLKRTVAWLLAGRLRGLVEADLAVRGGDPEAVGRLERLARRLAVELAGLEPLVADEWRAELAHQVGWLMEGVGGERASTLDRRLRSERYLALLDQLVAVARSPRLGEHGALPALTAVRAAVREAVGRVDEAVAAALAGQADAADEGEAGWAEASAALRRLEPVVAVLAVLDPGGAEAVERRLDPPRERLGEVCVEDLEAARTLAGVAALSPAEAFAAGRRVERAAGERRAARERFAAAWAKASRKLARELDR